MIPYLKSTVENFSSLVINACTPQSTTYLSSLTRAGIPPDLKMANRPWRWWLRLWRVPAAHFVVSRSFVLFIARTRAATICGEFMIAWRLASFLESWWTIIAACAYDDLVLIIQKLCQLRDGTCGKISVILKAHKYLVASYINCILGANLS